MRAGSIATGRFLIEGAGMGEQFLEGCVSCGYMAGKYDGIAALWRSCPECGTKLRKMGPTEIDLIADGEKGSRPVKPPESSVINSRPDI